jgi:hypothetical protein
VIDGAAKEEVAAGRMQAPEMELAGGIVELLRP